MTPEEVKQAKEIMDSVLKGTGELKPLTPVFPGREQPKKAKLPIDRPCSACSAGDTEMKYHDHSPLFREQPQAEPRKIEDVIEARERAESDLAKFKEERLKDQYEARPFTRQPDAHIKHTEHWLQVNQKHSQDVRWSLYPIGMVGTWIDHAERAENALREARDKILEEVAAKFAEYYDATDEVALVAWNDAAKLVQRLKSVSDAVREQPQGEPRFAPARADEPGGAHEHVFTCKVCGLVLTAPAGTASELRPYSAPHDGSMVVDWADVQTLLAEVAQLRHERHALKEEVKWLRTN